MHVFFLIKGVSIVKLLVDAEEEEFLKNSSKNSSSSQSKITQYLFCYYTWKNWQNNLNLSRFYTCTAVLNLSRTCLTEEDSRKQKSNAARSHTSQFFSLCHVGLLQCAIYTADNPLH